MYYYEIWINHFFIDLLLFFAVPILFIKSLSLGMRLYSSSKQSYNTSIPNKPNKLSLPPAEFVIFKTNFSYKILP